MRKSLKVLTVGCKANFADSASIVRAAVSAGFEIVSPRDPADVVVVNSCTVTHRADRDTRALARKARRENPGAAVVLAGCYARLPPAQRGTVPGVDHWIGAGDAGTLAALLRRIGGVAAGGDGPAISDHAADLLLGHRRTFLRIQDGCDFRCAYCVVPVVRGPNRSRPEDEIAAEAARSEDDGAREIVLTGIHIGLYGTDRGGRDGLAGLVRRLLRATSGVRFRLSSVEPMEITEPLLAAIAGSSRVCPHLHVPLQSGCDRTLSRMRRPYDAARYARAVSRAAAAVPDIQIGADVIAGFPGESRDDHERTVGFLRDVPVDYLHVFPYSARPGTESAGWADDVPPAEKRERVARLLALDASMRAAFLRRQEGKALDVLAESFHHGRGELSGRAGNYAEAAFPGPPEGVGRIFRVRVAGSRGKTLLGAAT
ncbi:MAG: MiaB/RimO family radical SAM methylthiotransferase [Gemmatimonadota bacterium]